jgi:hypothetical protein
VQWLWVYRPDPPVLPMGDTRHSNRADGYAVCVVCSCVLPLESGGEKLESGSKWSSEAHHALQHLPATQRTEARHNHTDNTTQPFLGTTKGLMMML